MKKKKDQNQNLLDDIVDGIDLEIGLQNKEVLFTEEQKLVVDRMVQDYRVKIIDIGMKIFEDDKYRVIEKIELLENIGVETISLENVKHIIFDGEPEETSYGFKIE